MYKRQPLVIALWPITRHRLSNCRLRRPFSVLTFVISAASSNLPLLLLPISFSFATFFASGSFLLFPLVFVLVLLCGRLSFLSLYSCYSWDYRFFCCTLYNHWRNEDIAEEELSSRRNRQGKLMYATRRNRRTTLQGMETDTASGTPTDATRKRKSRLTLHRRRAGRRYVEVEPTDALRRKNRLTLRRRRALSLIHI